MESAVETATPPRLNAVDLVRLSQGFSCVFWGLPVALLFCVQIHLLDVLVADPRLRISMRQLYFMLFLAMLATICVGAWKFCLVKVIGPRWLSRARCSLVFAALILYFSPFLYWWRALPHNLFLTINLFGLILVVIGFLISMNLLSMELGRFLGDRSLRKESRLFLGLNALVLAVPTAGSIGWAVMVSWKNESLASLGLGFLALFHLHYPWKLMLFVLLFLPVSLTLANLWRVKEILVERLKQLSD